MYILVETVAAGLMFARRRQQPDRSRVFIAFFFFLSAASAVAGLVLRIMRVAPFVSGEVMTPLSIILGFITYFLLLLYPIEVMRPRWLNVGRAVGILAPWLFFLFCLVALMPFGGVRSLRSLSDTARNIGCTDVYLRVVMSLIFIPYGIWLCRFQYNWKRSSASKVWMRSIVALAMLMTVTFSLHSIFGIGWMLYAHFALYFLLTFLILKFELGARLRVPEGEDGDAGNIANADVFQGLAPGSASGSAPDSVSGSATDSASDFASGSEAGPATFYENGEGTCSGTVPDADSGDAAEADGGASPKVVPSRVMEKLKAAIDDPLVWQNPEMNVGILCDLVGTNTNYLQKAIREMGWQSYSDMINRRRVEYICERLSSGETDNIQDAFYRAGYRSRVTAWRNFAAITGVSPLEWTSRLGERFDAAVSKKRKLS